MGIALLAAVVLYGGSAGAMVSEGTLLTNQACASFRAADNTVMEAVTYCATQNVIVFNPSLALRKTSAPTMQCSGGTVTFCIYVINTSTGSSAFNIIVEDIMPGDGAGMGMAFVGRVAGDNWNPGGATIVNGYRTTDVIPIRVWNADPAIGTVGTYYLRWAVSMVGPGRSMAVCFKATVL